MAFQNMLGRLVDVIFAYDFFVSYTWADGSKYAHILYEKLKAHGFTVFLDEEDYATGDNWTLLRRRALRKTRQLNIYVGGGRQRLFAAHSYQGGWPAPVGKRASRPTRKSGPCRLPPERVWPLRAPLFFRRGRMLSFNGGEPILDLGTDLLK